MKRYLLRTATVAALAAGLAFAQAPAAANRPRARAAVRQRILAGLNLTDSQKAQAKEIVQQAMTAAQPVRQQLQQNRQALAAAVKADDAGQIQTLATAQGALQGQVLAIQATARAKVFALLTPEQKAKAQQKQQKIQQLLKQLRALRNNP